MIQYNLAIFFLFVCNFLHGQTLVYENATKLKSSINTLADESHPIVDPNGQTIYFSRKQFQGNVGGEFAGSDVWIGLYSGDWMLSKDKFPYNSKKNEEIIGVSGDGKTIYLMITSPWDKVKGIYASHFTNGEWSSPSLIRIPEVQPGDYLGFFINPEGDVILISMAGTNSIGKQDIYVSIKDKMGLWSIPLNLGTTINTSGFEISPFLSRDRKKLYFTSDGHGGLGNGDIFVSERLYDSWGSWSTPRNLGPPVNSPGFDAYFSSYDSIAYFCSSRENKSSDIYSVTVQEAVDSIKQKIEKLKEDAKSILVDLNSSSLRESFWVQFDKSRSDLSASSKIRIDRFIGVIQNRNNKVLKLIGYASSAGGQELAQKRVNSVASYINQYLKNIQIETEIILNGDSEGENAIEIRY